MSKIVIVVAYGITNRVIGKDTNLPWAKLKDDMVRFSKLTKGKLGYDGNTLLVGRKTFESFGGPLPERDMCIITRNTAYVPQGANERTFCFSSLADAIAQQLQRLPGKDLFIIGGGEIYKEALYHLPADLQVDEIVASEVEGQFDGDTYFPELPGSWKKELVEQFPQNERNAHPFRVINYTRIA